MSRPLSVLLLRLEWRVALVGILAVAILFTGSLWWSGQWRLPGFPPLIELRAKVAPAEPIFLDRFGRVLQELPRKSLAPRLNWLPLGSVSPELVDAIVTFQDRRFYRHYGVDLRAFGGAARDAVQGHVHSAMTITMRTAELLRGRDHEMGGTGLAGFERVAQALLLDAQWKKTEILEAYLNLAPFAPDLIGVDQASRVLFQKESQSLDPREIALLTALLLDSKDNLPRLVSKACHVLRHMKAEALVETKIGEGCPELAAYIGRTLFSGPRASGAIVNHAPELAALVLARAPGSSAALTLASQALDTENAISDSARLVAGSATLRAQAVGGVGNAQPKSELEPSQTEVEKNSLLDRSASPRAIYAQAVKAEPHAWKTTIDRDLQLQAGRELERLPGMAGAILILDNRTSEVLAYTTSNRARIEPNAVDLVQERRPVGTLLDPFVFALAFEQRILTPKSSLEDLPVQDGLAGGIERPEANPSSGRALVSAREALMQGLRVPTEKVYRMIDKDSWFHRLRGLGFRELDLAAPGASLWEMTNAYRAMANLGWYSEPRLLVDEFENRLVFGSSTAGRANPRPQQIVFRPGTSFLVNEALADRNHFGLAPKLNFWAAARHSSTLDGNNHWCVGFSSRYTVGVWLGKARADDADSGATELELADTIWRRLMESLHQDFVKAGLDVSEPGSRLVLVDIVKTGAAAPERLPAEVKRVGLEPSAPSVVPTPSVPSTGGNVLPAPKSKPAMIVSPERGSRVGAQKPIIFRAQGPLLPEANWLLNGEDLGSATKLVERKLRRGRHWLAVRDKRGRILDEVRFEVR